MATSDSNLMKSLMYMFTMMMTDALEDEASAKDSKNVKIWIVVCFIGGRSGGIGAITPPKLQIKFSTFL